VKILKVEYLVTAIKEHKMDQAIIFCRTKLDCDNVEQYLVSLGGGSDNALSNSGACCFSVFVEFSVKGLKPIRMNVVFFQPMSETMTSLTCALLH